MRTFNKQSDGSWLEDSDTPRSLTAAEMLQCFYNNIAVAVDVNTVTFSNNAIPDPIFLITDFPGKTLAEGEFSGERILLQYLVSPRTIPMDAIIRVTRDWLGNLVSFQVVT